MIKTFHTPKGIITLDSQSVTDDQLNQLGLTFDQAFPPEELRIDELERLFAQVHASKVIPPPGLTEIVCQICEYITLKASDQLFE